MFQVPDYNHNFSLRLSKFFSDIGVNDRVVMKRRGTILVDEALDTIHFRLRDEDTTIYRFGSRSEGTTTPSLKSDFDILMCRGYVNIMQNLTEWKPGNINLLMIQDENTPSGYCLLQGFRADAPNPIRDIPTERYTRDSRGRILCITIDKIRSKFPGDKVTVNGPALTHSSLNADCDHVFAYRCKSWPLEARPWLHRHSVGTWPSQELKRLSEIGGCFVVKVGNRGSDNEAFQWRISTSLAERYLMFSLNITQIRCYILMKMILKTYINTRFENILSSFMCKNVLLHCIENTHSEFWQENNLLPCFTLYLFFLYNCVLFEHCPHFILPGNNLMARRIPAEVKPQLLKILNYLICSNGTALLGIDIDYLGWRLFGYVIPIKPCGRWMSVCISGQLIYHLGRLLTWHSQSDYEPDLRHNERTVQFLLKTVEKLTHETFYEEGHEYEQTAIKLILQVKYTLLGSLLASRNISVHKTVSLNALAWFSAGLNSDVSSSRLKLASVFYCSGDMRRADIVLKDVEKRYVLHVVEPVCACDCSRIRRNHLNKTFCYQSYIQEEISVENLVAFCIAYMPSEINSVPKELQHELFRSTYKDILLDADLANEQMDMAVVDSLPYLYFLQYKTYGYLGQHEDQQRALNNLVWILECHPNLEHQETGLNLLGQCMEQENRLIDALQCYQLSLDIRQGKSAARMHICRVLNKLINDL